jgi:hypothetical protein
MRRHQSDERDESTPRYRDSYGHRGYENNTTNEVRRIDPERSRVIITETEAVQTTAETL